MRDDERKYAERGSGYKESTLLKILGKYVYVIIGLEVLSLFIILIFFYLFHFAFPVYNDLNKAIESLVSPR